MYAHNQRKKGCDSEVFHSTTAGTIMNSGLPRFDLPRHDLSALAPRPPFWEPCYGKWALLLWYVRGRDSGREETGGEREREREWKGARIPFTSEMALKLI
jgi:hypothetical protein